MPELPEVETIRRQLGPAVVGRTVTEAWSHESHKFVPARAVVGARIERIDRRGKYLLFGLDDDRELVVHLGMTGRLLPRELGDDAHLRARWGFDDGSVLSFHDVRRFGRISVVDTGRYEGTLARLGPEPFDPAFTGTSLFRALRASRRPVKTQLLGQGPVAGLGNIYADEACFLAGVHPGARRITRVEAAALRDAIVEVLSQGVANGGTTLRDYVDAAGDAGTNQHHLRCYGRADEPCDRCGTALRRIVLDARSTTFCPSCQRRR